MPQAATRNGEGAVSEKRLLRVGMAQVDCALNDVLANLAKATELVEAHRDHLDLLIFPELSLTGYSVGEQFHSVAMRLDNPDLQRLMEAAQGITVGVGLIEETPSFRFYNSFIYFRDGEIVHTHRKIYLPNYDIFEEKKYFAVGSRFDCFNMGQFRLGQFICGDAWNPALVHIAAADEANVLVFSACSPDYALGNRLSNRKNWLRLARFYAIMYGAYVIFVNRTGEERGLSFYGRSTIFNPFGEVTCSARGTLEGVSTCRINLNQVRKARTVLHTMRDENLDFIQRNLTRVMQAKDYL